MRITVPVITSNVPVMFAKSNFVSWIVSLTVIYSNGLYDGYDDNDLVLITKVLMS